ncbi:MAG: hypothetical protein GQ474_09460, partial [Sulfurimonas sp.]|nr:hypothetical protein [Sulfurimonas sp.]
MSEKETTVYTCPMHLEIKQDHQGTCPKCGMALEQITIQVDEENEELTYMSKRFWISLFISLP